MGTPIVKLTLSNPAAQQLAPIQVDAVADTGAVLTCIPEHVANQLRLRTKGTREVRLANGQITTCRYVGPIQIDFENRSGCGGALVLGEKVLLGAVTMEDMDLIAIPSTRSVAVNPANPNMAVSKIY